MGRASRRAFSRLANVSLVLGVVTALISAVLFVQAPAASAHHAEVSPDTAVICTDEGLAVNWVAESWNFNRENGLHPLIHVDMRTDVTTWVTVGQGAFTDENGRRFEGTTAVPEGATFVEIRVRPDENEYWGGSTATGGTRTLGIAISEELQQCGPQPPLPAGLGDFVWLDLNDNALQDAGEPGVADVPVVLWTADADGQPIEVIAETTTAADGSYAFQQLDPTLTYVVQFDADDLVVADAGDDALDSDADAATGITGPVTLTPGDFDPTIDAGIVAPPAEPCSLGDRVWFDANQNGIQDDGEPGIAGVEVTIWEDTDGDGSPDVVAETVWTDDNGNWLVSLECGRTYIVQVTPPPECDFTQANAGGDDVDSDIHGDTGLSDPITLQSGTTDVTLDAGLISLKATVGDRVWFDTNGNGIQDDGEPGVPGVTVILWEDVNSDGVPDNEIRRGVTDADGLYLFDKLLTTRVYQIQFIAPDGNSFTVRDAGSDDAADSDADTVTGLTDSFTLAQREVNLTYDAGLIETPPARASLGDKVWFDADQDGIQDDGEVPVAGVTVALWIDTDADGAPDEEIARTTTDDAGMYGFADLDPDLTYIVQFLPGADYVLTAQDQGGDDAVDSDADPASGITGPIDLDPGENDPTIDAGVYQPAPEPASLGDTVWSDLDGDGVQDDNEPGVSGVTVVLWEDTDGDGAPDVELRRVVTDDDGMYLFDELDPTLTYVVQFIAPDGSVFTGQDQGGDDAADSDADPTTGITGPITLQPGENDLTIDAGLVDEPASLGDKVWSDLDGDGIQDDGEPGVAGVTVVLWADGDRDGQPDTELASTTTDDAGMYAFTGLDPDVVYIVEFRPGAGGALTAQDQGGDDAVDSDADQLTGFTGTISLEPGENNPTIDAGLIELASLGDKVWFDSNGDGVQGADEDPVAGVEVVLWIDEDGDGVADFMDRSTTTDAAGMYGFTDLDPNKTYLVQFVAPDGQSLTVPNAGSDDAVDSDADPTTGFSDPIDLDPGENDPTIDAGLIDTPVELASLGDKVWSDLDADGIQDEGEPGVGGVTVKLWTANDDGTPNEQIAETTTDTEGMYGFADLDPSLTYIVAFEVPADLGTLTDADQGDDDAVDSDADATSGLTAPISLEPGENNPTIDAGVVPVPCRLGDRVWLDVDGDGIQDAGELGIGGVVVQVWSDTDGDGTPDEIIAMTTTAADGFYEVIVPCDEPVFVEFVAPDGRDFSEADRGDDDAVDSDPDPTTGITPAITVSGGDTDTTVDAGIIGITAEVDIEKATNGVDADVPADRPVVAIGEAVTWTYVVTNTGDVDLANVAVDDDIEGPVCVIPLLEIGDSTTCHFNGTATVDDYINVGSATGDPVDENGDPAIDLSGLAVPKPTDEDPSGYTGVDAEVLGLEIKCASSGILAVLTNTGSEDITLTVNKDATKVGDFLVPAGGTVDAPVPLAEGAKAVIEVFSGDLRVGTAAIQRDCEKDPELPKTGAESGQLALLAVGLIGFGALMTAGSRRLAVVEV